jgi:phosphatidylserine/phosphatidylglycerophosphate/cardiolipin synthase-like enzyme
MKIKRLYIAAFFCGWLTPAYGTETTTAQVSACFVPAESCVTGIVAAIDHSTTQIRVQAYGFTSPPILKALTDAERRGVDVAIILDKSNNRQTYSGATFVSNAGIPVWIDTIPTIAHNKIIIIDGHLVIGGSYNYTSSAERHNAENVTYIDSQTVANWYLDNWDSRMAVSERYGVIN